MRYSVLSYILLAGVAIVSGCAGIMAPEVGGEPPASEAKPVYRDVFDDWTREGRIYDGLATKLISKVTFKSAVFRQAYASEYARLYKMDGPATEKLVLDQQKAAADYHDFVIAAYVPEKSMDTFSKKKSMWKIYLTRDGVEQIQPIEIRKLKKKDPIKDYFYPYVTTWKSIYHVRFPTIDPKTGSPLMDDPYDAFTLVMASVLGSVEFKWNYNRKQ